MCIGLMRYRGTWDINAIGLTLLREDQRDAYSASSGRGSKTRTLFEEAREHCLSAGEAGPYRETSGELGWKAS